MYKSLEEYNKELLLGMKAGYTTGTCACAASKAALLILLGEEIELVKVKTPAGISLELEPVEIKKDSHSVSLAIKKYAGDDPDVTDGILIYSRVRFLEDLLEIDEQIKEALLDRDLNKEDDNIIYICGGKGVGKLSKKGLDRDVGEAAINSVPRKMIREHLKEVLKDKKIKKDVLVEIFAPLGQEVAEKTFNKKLGIEGGISILGTSGIVTPMSKQALIDTIKVDMKARRLSNEYIVAVPGNYGMDYISTKFGFDKEIGIEFSNYVGEAIDYAVNLECKGILLVGHIGKFVKLAGGIMNTHSNEADARAELIAAHILKCKFKNISSTKILSIAKEVLASNTSDESVKILKNAGILNEVMDSLGKSMYKYVLQRVKKALILGKKMSNKYGINTSYYSDENEIKIAIISFNLEEGELIRVGHIEEILENIRK